jgi:iron(III) transport system substrate-binding protein
MNWRLLPILVLAMTCGCIQKNDGQEIVVYTALDQEFSEPIYKDFEQASGVNVLAKFDIESTKTVGLTAALIAEANQPRCDVFWNNEILNTIRLENQGLLEVYVSPAAYPFPRFTKSGIGSWQGFAARARILLVNTDLVSPENRPKSIFDLANAKWKGKTAIAKPLAGTTATHVACLFATLGDERANSLLTSMVENDIQILGGNKQVALAVSSGQVAFGLTDTDDAMVEVEKGAPVVIIYPDREEKQLGTLFIPNTVAIIKGCPHPKQAKKLVDYLLSPAVEEKLANGGSAQIPLNPAVKAKARIETPATVKAMAADFEAAAKKWETAQKFVKVTMVKE